ncbi:MAG: SpoIID/LytB domain-containing protein [Vicinamibacterales bacterium]
MTARRGAAAALGWALVLAAGLLAQSAAPAEPPPGAAWFVRSLVSPADRQEAGSDILDQPVLPGSIIKAVTLAAALESQVIEPGTTRLCRRVVTIDGRRFVCSHPDLKRPLTPAEALAHSCNDFFVSLAPRLPRGILNQTRQALGLPPVSADTPLAPALVGLAGPRVTPRALLDVVARLAGADPDRPVRLRAETRRVILEGLRGAATYGTASALAAAGVPALAKTGTAPMPGGGFMGLAVALAPPDHPTRGVVVVAPGAAGLDAAAMAADLLRRPAPAAPPPPRTPAAPPAPAAARVAPAPAAAPVARTVEGDPGVAALTAASRGVTIRLGLVAERGRTRVQSIALEDYVARVLAGEGEPRAGDAAQQALAVVIRTFALANQHRHRGEGFDLCDTTHCQVVRPSTPASRRAALATAGQVLLANGQPAFVFYSAWCGGHTEIASAVWPGADDYGQARSIADPYCAREPGWTSEVRARDVERALRLAGSRGDRLRGLRIVARDASGRVARLRADGFSPAEVGGHEFRMALGRVAGWQSLKSTAFDLQRTGAGYRFRGVGFGHGVGLCVVGAGNRADDGQSAAEILRFYFPQLAVGDAAGARAAAAPAPAAPTPAATPPAPRTAAAPILLSLPAGESSERAVVLDLLTRARAGIAALAGVTPPAEVRVTVHPSVESFGRETGQPWWVAGATVGASIDLLPVTMLRRQGQLERTIRHEMAHVLVDGALTGRPVWVREGAAFYFADPDGGGDLPSRVDRPTDEELLRPVSAGAQREAYGRAEACFRREIAAGKRWNEIR